MHESAKQMQLGEALDRLNKAGLIVEAADEYRQKVVNKLAGIIDRCYDLDDKGHSYANDIASRWEKHIAEMKEKGVDANETAEVLWYVSKHNNLQSQPLYYTYQFYTRHDPEYFKEWTGLNA
jgi:DNA-binding PadR family transcriptional regulator